MKPFTQNEPLPDAELDRLGDFLKSCKGGRAMNVEELDGFFAALISFALGLFNLLPLPALDGGRAAFIVAELIRGKPVDPEKEAIVHITGFAVLIALMLVINFYNVVQIYQGKGPF